MNDLTELLKFEGKEITHYFEKASLEGKGTPQEVADRREIAVTNFLKKYFPFPYRVAKGNIVDSSGNRSASIDCILLNPSHPFTTTDGIKYSIILADGVDAVFEVKPELNSQREIERSLQQIHSVKVLTRNRSGVFNSMVLFSYTNEYVENSKKIPSIIFSKSTYQNDKQLLETIVAYYEANSLKREYQFDLIVVNNSFIVLNSKKDFYVHLNGFDDGIYILNFGELTLSAFLLYLNQLPQSEMRRSSTVLEHYLQVKPENIKTYTDLNQRLLKI